MSSSNQKVTERKRADWIFSQEHIKNSPSSKDGIDNEKELHYRQQAANFIQDMGQHLKTSQLCINTGIVYMHRFYMIWSLKRHHRYNIAPACIFLAAKVEEQPKKLENVIKVCYRCLNPNKPDLDPSSQEFAKLSHDLVRNELIVLDAIKFDVSVVHPHTHVVKCTQMLKVSREFAQMAYFMATNSLHLTPFSVLYGPTQVAAMCIYLSCKWSNMEVPKSVDGKPFWEYIDDKITEPLLEDITKKFLQILERYPTRLNKLRNYQPTKDSPSSGNGGQSSNRPAAANRPAAVEAGATRDTKAEGDSRQAASPWAQPKKPGMVDKKPGMSIDEYKRKQMSGNGGQQKHAGARSSHSNPNLMGPPSNQSSRSSHPPPYVKVDKVASGGNPHPSSGGNHNQHVQQQQAYRSTSRSYPEDQHQQHLKQHDHNMLVNKNLINNFNSRQMAELYMREPEKLRKFLKHTLARARELNKEEAACLAKLEKKEEERRKKKMQQHHHHQQQVAANIATSQASHPTATAVNPSMKMKIAASSDQATSGASSHARKRAHPESYDHHQAAKYAKRPDEVSKSSSQHQKQHHTQPNSQSHRMPPHYRHASSKHSMEQSSDRKMLHKHETKHVQNYSLSGGNGSSRTNGGSGESNQPPTNNMSSHMAASNYGLYEQRPPQFDSEVPDDLFDDQQG